MILREQRSFNVKSNDQNPVDTKPVSYSLRLLQSCGFFRDFHYWNHQINIIDGKIETACKEIYRSSRVYVTFETEQEQRYCLSELSTSLLAAKYDHVDKSVSLTLIFTKVNFNYFCLYV